MTFVGLGPGGTGPLINAAQHGVLDTLLSVGVQFVEQSAAPGCGRLGGYALRADSSGSSFLEATDQDALLRCLQLDPEAEPIQSLQPYRQSHPPLRSVAEQLDLIGSALACKIRASERSQLHTRTSARSIHLQADGSVVIRARGAEDGEIEFHSRAAVIALGARARETPPDALASACSSRRTMVADELLRTGGLERVESELSGTQAPRVLILGGSHSAYSAAWRLLQSRCVDWVDSSISIFQRREPVIFYPNRAEADADRYRYVEADICPRTQRIHRLGGLRADGRDLYRQIRVHRAEQRVALHSTSEQATLLHEIDRADLVVYALGYQPRTLPIFDSEHRPLALAADQGSTHVDQSCRIRLADGSSIPNLYGIGLSSGFIPDGEMGGEPSFRGETNGVWLYQNGIGRRVLESLRVILEEAA